MPTTEGEVTAFNSITGAPAPSAFNRNQLQTDLAEVASDLAVPGYAYALTQSDQASVVGVSGVTRDSTPFTSETPLRFASVTKAITGIALLQLENRGLLDLDDPLTRWDESYSGPAEVTVRQVAAHVSEGTPGATYVYSSGRYARLRAVIEGASGQALDDYFCEHILTPAGAECLESPALGTHAGLVSNVRDMEKVFQALLLGGLPDTTGALEALATPYELSNGTASPVSFGFFVTRVDGEPVLWSFGQDDPEHSGVRVILWPERQTSFVYLANSNAVSDAYRLLGGSPNLDPVFHAVVEAVQGEDAMPPAIKRTAELLTAIYNRDIEQVTGVFEAAEVGSSWAHEPGLTYASSIMCRLDTGYGPTVLPILATAAAEYAEDPWSLLFAAEGHEICGEPELAAVYFEQLRTLTNQENDLIGRLRHAWANAGLARLTRCSDPELARRYVEDGLSTGVTGQTRDGLLEIRETLAAAGSNACEPDTNN